MSGHFSKLKQAGLIHADQRGTTVVYSINVSTLEEVLLGFMGVMGIATNKGEGP
jgi:DNA-binding transcriptional ArsR family regulator